MGNINISTWDLYRSGDLEFEDTPKDGGSSFGAVSGQERPHVFESQDSISNHPSEDKLDALNSDTEPNSGGVGANNNSNQKPNQSSSGNTPLSPRPNKPNDSKHSWRKPFIVTVILLLLLGSITAFALYRNSVAKYNNLKSAQSALQQELLKSDEASAEELKELGNKVSIIRGELDKDIPEDLQAQYQDLLLQINSLTQSSNQAVANSAQDLLAKLTNQAGAGISLSPDGKTITNSGVLSVNSQTGNLSIQGTPSQTNVTQNGSTTTIGAAQDIAQTSSPTFNNQTLTGNGSIQGGLTVSGTTTTNNLTIQSSGTQNGYALCDASNNCGYSGAGSSYVQGGNSFGNPAYLGTNDSNSLNLETNGTTRLTIDTAGNTSLTGNLTTPGSVSALSLSGNGSGVTNVDATALNGNTAGNNSGQIALNNGTINSNLNSDLLDGQHGSYYQNASNINAGTLSDARLSSNVTLQGNSFNGINQLVQLNGSGYLPSLNGSLVTNVDALTLQGNSASYFTNASNITSGTLSDLRLSSNVPLKNATNTFTGTNNFAGVTATGILQGGYSVCDASNNCNYAPISGGAGYIQNGTAIQSGANFYIAGTGRMDRLTLDGVTAMRDNRDNTLLTQSANNISSNRTLTIGNATYWSQWYSLTGSGKVGIGDDPQTMTGSTGRLTVSVANSASIGVVVRGAVSQAGDLQQWQNSAGTALSVVTADGRFGIGAAPGTNVALNVYKSADQHQYVNQTLVTTSQAYENYYAFKKIRSDNAAVLYSILGGVKAVGHNGTSEYDAGIIRFDSGNTGQGSIYISTAEASTLQRAMSIHYNGNVGIGISTPANLARLGVVNSLASTIGLVVQGASSQSSSLQQWRDDSGFVLGSVSPLGLLAMDRGVNAISAGLSGATYSIGYNGTSVATWRTDPVVESGNAVFSPAAGRSIIVKSSAVGDTALKVKAFTGQTADLQQWQNSSGTVLSRITSDGRLAVTDASDGVVVASVGSQLVGAGINLGRGKYDTSSYGLWGNPDSATGDGNITIAPRNKNTSNGAYVTVGQTSSSTDKGYIRLQAGYYAGNSMYGRVVISTGAGRDANSLVVNENQQVGIGTATFGASNKFTVNSNTTSDNSAAVQINTGGTSNKGIVVQGATSQTANLQEWQNSTGTVLAALQNTGNLTLTQDNANLNVGTSQKGYVAIGAQGDYSGNFANRGAICIDTACIQGNGGGGLTSTNSAGTLGTGFVRSGGVYGNSFGSFSNRVAIMNTLEVLSNTKAHAGFNITPVTGVAALFGTSSTSNVNIASRATSGQTADLLQAQDSTGTVLARITASGDLTVKNASVEGAYITFSNNIRGYNVSVAASATSQTVSFGTAHPDANYAVFCTPDWNTSCYVSNKTVNGFTLNYGTAAPATQQVDWFVAR